ncbi:MAG TPA: threonine/serine exporter family protein [Candidatus Baltobacteraceae bacterium]|nr:threonine/serine exporter family protein [Candidatus Baltobacteraceae bacterium]
MAASSFAAIQEDPKAIFVTQLARELHRAGVASDQLERTITAISAVLGLQIEIFALPTNITIAIGPRYAQQIVMLRLNPGRVNLRKLALLNDVFDDLQSGRIDLPDAIAQLRSIDAHCPPPPALLTVGALACVAVGVAVLLGGGIHELIVAALIGAATGILSFFTTRNAVMDRLFEVFAAFVATLIVAAYTHYIHPANLYVSIVAGVVVLLPGYSLTLALHELANQDLIAGTARLGRVLAILLALGCGAFLGFAVAGVGFINAADVRPHPVGPAFWIVAIVLLSFGLSVDLDARFRDFAWVFLASIVALGTSYIFTQIPGAHQVAPFLASLICGLVANGGAKFLRVPQPVFLVPALHVLVPGSLSYQSVLWVVSRNNYADAAALAVNALVVAVLIVAGLLLSQLIVPGAPLRLRETPS